MKKRWIAGALAGFLAVNVLTVSAQDLSNVEPAGNTEVTANVSGSGDVTYLVSIPERVNFGTLTQPENNTQAHPAVRSFNVEAVQITGLDAATQRVVVLLKDGSNAGGFQLTGQSASNSGKVLNYTVCNETGTDITGGRPYDNGYLLAAFSAGGQNVAGQLKLEQNQLYGENLEQWAGNYKGTINFFTRVASLADIN
ncbi:MAG: hypothetical protein K1W34_08510 [Lachnospiraceae bacterium]